MLGSLLVLLRCVSSYVPSPTPASTPTPPDVPPAASSARIEAPVPADPAPVPAAATALNEDIAEAVFRYQFGHNASGAQQSAGVYCLDLTGSDPSAAFLARFGTQRPPVRPASACKTSAREGVVDIRTGKHGLIFSVRSVTWDGSSDDATADGGYYEGGLSASGNTYTLKRSAGRWSVVKDVMHWIS
jgi:hypothetical protein